MRNQRRDAAEKAARREQLLEAGFRVFSEHTIEAVPLQQVADEAGVGIATLYRYFGTKLSLVIGIASWKWTEELADAYRRFDAEGLREETAARQFAFFLGEFLRLYRENKPLLRFNENFTIYLKHAGADREQMQPVLDYELPLLARAHEVFLRGKQDGTLRTELGEEQLFLATLHGMLAVVGKYAHGLLYAGDNEELNLRELGFLHDMILHTCTRESGEG